MTLNGLSKFSTVTITSVAERQSLTWSWIKSQLYCKIEIKSFKPLVNTEKHPKYSWHVYILIYNLYTSTLLKIVRRLSLKHGIRSDNKKSIFWTFRFATKDLMFSSSFPFTKLFKEKICLEKHGYISCKQFQDLRKGLFGKVWVNFSGRWSSNELPSLFYYMAALSGMQDDWRKCNKYVVWQMSTPALCSLLEKLLILNGRVSSPQGG